MFLKEIKVSRLRDIALALFCFFIFPFAIHAQETRQYEYDRIYVDIQVNQDSTFTVRESLTYDFRGEYHQGFRDIPLNKISRISDITVYESGLPLSYSSKSLDKTDSSSWGKYTTYYANGAENIEWYYDAKDEVRTWVIQYKVHGGLSFLKEKDELYWNLFTNYDVPIRRVEAKVSLPDYLGDYALPFPSSIYVDGADNPLNSQTESGTFVFSADNVQPKGKVTIAAGWPKGIVLQSAFWKDWFLMYLSPILNFLFIFLTLIFLIGYWYISEKRDFGRGTVVAQYEPPKNLRPAMAEVITKERVTSHGWAATIVDLAVRGYLKIEEEDDSVMSKIARNLFLLIFIIISLFFSFPLIMGFIEGGWFQGFILLAVLTLFFVRIYKSAGKSISAKDYVVVQLKKYDDEPLEDYEKDYLDAILVGGKFSTRSIKRNSSRAQRLSQKIREIQRKLYKETEADTLAFEKPVSKEGWLIFTFILIFISVFISLMSVAINNPIPRPIDSTIVAVLCSLAAYFFMRFEAKLTEEGEVLKEEWLGFKLYLKTAERYRMQNLTPDIFEKYLPYAIIFGVEKQWGKAFESISMPPPSWYGSTAGTHAFASSGGTSGFSASAFSSSFSSSFASAFASSGGGGASGGGGGAGGGGGGGGGGAS